MEILNVICRLHTSIVMGEGHVILLANFYGSYLNKNKFRASVIVNNAGIEQLATLGKYDCIL